MRRIESNYQDLLKILALAAMIIDHLGLYFYEDIAELRIIGRFSMPIFAFFTGYNFKGSVRISIFIYGMLLYVISRFFIFELLTPINILISLFLGQLLLKFLDKQLKNFWLGYLLVVIIVSLSPLSWDILDYGTNAVGIVMLGYLTRKNPDLRYFLTLAAVAIGFIHTDYVFYRFTHAEQIMAIAVSIMCFISLNIASYQHKFAINLLPISRRLLEIYCLQLLIIRFVWRYYYFTQNIS